MPAVVVLSVVSAFVTGTAVQAWAGTSSANAVPVIGEAASGSMANGSAASIDSGQTASASTEAATATTPVLDAEEAAMCRSINTYRAQHGRTALRVSTSLTRATTWQTTDMAQKNYFNHTDSLHRTPPTRMAAFGYRYASSYWAENIAAGYPTAAATLAQWKASSLHNTNMLNPANRVIGISRTYGASSTYGWYWSTDFGGTTDASVPCPR